MFIAYNEQNYPCKCRPGSTMTYSGLPDDFPAPVSGEIILCANDGFELRRDKVEDYLRQTFEVITHENAENPEESWTEGVLTLTNQPEPEPEPDPEPETDPEPTADELLDILLGVSE